MSQLRPCKLIALEVLVVSSISHMSDEPINNTKKLLDLYREILLVNETVPSNPDLVGKLNQWKKNAGLKKTVESILDANEL